MGKIAYNFLLTGLLLTSKTCSSRSFLVLLGCVKNINMAASTGCGVFDVCVVGAGIEGSSAARYLASRGKNTLLLEQVYKSQL